MLEAISWVAAIASILAFLGYSADFIVKVTTGAALSFIALLAGLSTLFSAVRLWKSPRGAGYPPRYHFLRIGRAVGALVLSGFVIVAVLQAIAVHSPPPHTPHKGPVPNQSASR